MFSPYYYEHFGAKVSLKFLNKIWWYLMPGVAVKVKWPTGPVVVGPNSRNWDGVTNPCLRQLVESADPNDHYRPWMEANVGRQGWDWDWCMRDNDVTENRLTIKFRRAKQEWAIIAALKWS
jgi:hypothetical protein